MGHVMYQDCGERRRVRDVLICWEEVTIVPSVSLVMSPK
jgi:hypothetical protein